MGKLLKTEKSQQKAVDAFHRYLPLDSQVFFLFLPPSLPLPLTPHSPNPLSPSSPFPLRAALSKVVSNLNPQTPFTPLSKKILSRIALLESSLFPLPPPSPLLPLVGNMPKGESGRLIGSGTFLFKIKEERRGEAGGKGG